MTFYYTELEKIVRNTNNKDPRIAKATRETIEIIFNRTQITEDQKTQLLNLLKDYE